MDTLVYDLEIAKEIIEVQGGWNNPYGMGLGSAVVYSYEKDRYYFFLHDKDKLNLTKLLNGNKIITFNGVSFDSKVVLGNKRRIQFGNFLSINILGTNVSWKEFDLFLFMKASTFKLKTCLEAYNCLKFPKKGILKLDNVAEKTLGVNQKKSGSGAMAPVLYKNKNYSELLEYNLQDVRITKKVYDFLNTNKYILDGDGTKYTLKKPIIK